MLSADLKQALLDRIHGIPVIDALGMRIDALDEGLCRATMPYDPTLNGVFESLAGGMLMTLADSVACFAIMTQTGPDIVTATTDMSIRFLGPCLTDATAEARVVKLGRTLCPVRVDLSDANGKLVAIAEVNYIRLDFDANAVALHLPATFALRSVRRIDAIILYQTPGTRDTEAQASAGRSGYSTETNRSMTHCTCG